MRPTTTKPSTAGFALSRRFALLSAAAAFAVLSAGCSSGVPDTVKIGVAVTLSGPTANRGQDLLNGAQMAADELNAAGFKVNGRPVKIEIVAKDDKADVETVKKVANELVAEKVTAVLGHVLTPQTEVAVPIYAEKKIPNFFTTTHKGLLALGKGNAFRLTASDLQQARALASFSIETLRANRMAVVYDSGSYGRDILADMMATLKESKREGAVTLQLPVDFKEPVTAELVGKIAQDKSDVVVLISREPHALSLLQEMKKAAFTDVAVLVVNPARTPKVAAQEAPSRGLFATATTVDAIELPGGAEFVNRFKEKYKAPPVWGAHYAYDTVYVLADMIKRTQSVKPDDLIAKLKTAELDARVLQSMRFAESGEQRTPSVGVYRAIGGSWQPQVRSAAW